MPQDHWFAVRTVFKFGETSNGKNVFEERILAFSAPSADDAMEKACSEANRYAEGSTVTEIHDDVWSYEQDGDDLIDGYELWSELYESEMSLNNFYAERYTKYKYEPE